MIGTTVGNYRIVEKLGDGGMGAVYRAVDEMLDREVAIKVLRPELARNAALIERFRQEAIALARLNHPRIATLHGLERHGDSLLMIMEYVRGDTLEAIVQRSGRLAWARAAELVAATLDALDHAHDKGVVHRDIKPANIMLSSSGAVKVMDFGIARLMGKSRQTQVGHAVGTPMYMAPEQLRGEEVDGRTDLYAAGAVLFELVTGRMAFEADSDYALMMKQLNEAPPSASSLVREVPTVIDEIILCAMAKHRDDRFADATAFREALEGAIGGRVAPARRTPVPAETRLAAPAVPPAATGDDVRPTTEHALTPPGETRLAPPAHTPAHTPAGEASRAASDSDIGATRYADADAPAATPATRLADARYATHANSAASSRQLQSAATSWTRDWRTFAIAGALFVAAGLAVRAMRPHTPQGDSVTGRGDSLVVAPDTARTLAQAAADTTRTIAAEDAKSLLINAPATRSGTGPVGGNANGAGSGRRVAPIGGTESPPGNERAPVERERARPVAPTERGSKEPVTVEGAGRTEPAPPPPPAPQPGTVNESEREATAIGAIREAIAGAAESLSGSNTGAAESLLSGTMQDKWISLMKEGRISMSPNGSPSVQLHGSRATAEFAASVNVRSPFGANKRQSARFAAELQRSGGSWRVVGLRSVGGLELK